MSAYPSGRMMHGVQPLTAQSAVAQSGHLGGDGRLIDKDETVRLEPHSWLAAIDLETSLTPDIGASGFRGHRCFLYVKPRLHTKRHREYG